MIARLWANLSNRSDKEKLLSSRQKLFLNERPETIYAIGDVHGCYELLKSLQKKIKNDADSHHGTKWVIMLGDYVDRGPNSASVVEEMINGGISGVTRFCLAGNHEESMLDFLVDPHSKHRWLGFGGLETLQSYGIYDVPTNRTKLKSIIESHIPTEHFAFLHSLPSLISTPGLCFAHAGIANGAPLTQQEDKDLLWSRPRDQKKPATINPFLTIHGHTPVKSVALIENRLNVDTGAYMTGRLSAVKISRDDNISVMHAD